MTNLHLSSDAEVSFDVELDRVLPKSGAFQLLDASQKPRAAGITNLISVFTNC